MPLVSIVIACYNHEKFIEDCIYSVIQQDYKNIEILICDDCSTDRSWEVLSSLKERMCLRFGRVVLYCNEKNRGVTYTLNSLIKNARGNLIKGLASDDVILDVNGISKFVSYMEEFPEIQVVISNGVLIDEDQHMPMAIDFSKKKRIYEERPVFDKSMIFEAVYQNNYIFAPGNMVRKEIYDKYGYYDVKLTAEDWDFWLRITCEGMNDFGYIEDALIGYRINENSLTAKVYNKNFEKKRIKMYTTNMIILDRYGDKVPPEIYARTKMRFLLEENKLAVRYNLCELRKITSEEYKRFKYWQYIDIKMILSIIKKKICGYVKMK